MKYKYDDVFYDSKISAPGHIEIPLQPERTKLRYIILIQMSTIYN